MDWMHVEGDTPGMVTVCVHGHPQYVVLFVYNVDNSGRVSPEEFYTYLKKQDLQDYQTNLDAKKNTIFLLYGCRTGMGKKSFAQLLSERLQEITIAPVDYLVTVKTDHKLLNIEDNSNLSSPIKPWVVYDCGRYVTSFEGCTPKEWINMLGGVEKAAEHIKALELKSHPWW